MSIDFFSDPGQAPKPRNEIRIEQVAALPYEDGRRVQLDISVTPFAPSDRPNLEIVSSNSQSEIVASMTVIETMQTKMSFTLHLKEDHPSGEYTLAVALYYDEEAIQDTKHATFLIG